MPCQVSSNTVLNLGCGMGEAGEQRAGEKDTLISPAIPDFRANKFIYAQKQKYLFRDA